jgi:hypothetical protein
LVLDTLLKIPANFYVVTEWIPVAGDEAGREVNKRRLRVVFLSYPKGSGFAGGEEAPTATLNCVLRGGILRKRRPDMLQQLWAMFQGLTGIATDQLALSLQEIPSSSAMEMGQVMQAVEHQ